MQYYFYKNLQRPNMKAWIMTCKQGCYSLNKKKTFRVTKNYPESILKKKFQLFNTNKSQCFQQNCL